MEIREINTYRLHLYRVFIHHEIQEEGDYNQKNVNTGILFRVD